MRRDWRAKRLAAWVCAACGACTAVAQTTNPVYVDDSAAATDTLARAPQLAASGNVAEAVRALQRILEEEPDRVAPDSGEGADPDVFTGVRRRVHRELLSNPALLEEYRRGAEARAAELLAAGEVAAVEQSYLLTPSGFRAALRLAQEQMEAAEFESARLTLEQLQDHPDRKAGDGRRDAAVMMRRLASYIDRPEVWARADAWASEAGLAPEGHRAVTPPPAAAVRTLTPLDAPTSGPGPLEANIPPTALWSVSVEDADVVTGGEEEDIGAGVGVRLGADGRGGVAPSDQRLWIFPTVVGDTLLVNNGTSIRAWDRFTLEPRWAVLPPPDPTVSQDELNAVAEERQSRRRGQQREDTAGVTVDGRIVLATTGLATDGLRIGDDRVHAMDLGTGRLLWSVAPWTLDEQLDQGSVRGPVMAGEGSAVVVVRKSVPPRRVVSSYLLGLDERTGVERWVRLVGSAGALPNQRERRVADSGVLEDGVIYLTDPVGIVAAVEAHTGRPIWVRRVPSTDIGYVSGSPGQTWESMTPVVSGDSVFVLSTDRDNVLQLDRATGRLRASRTSDQFGKPNYMIGVGGVLVAVGRDRLALIDMDKFASGPVRLSDRIEAEGGIRGRVIVSGGLLVVPTLEGAKVIDPAGAKTAKGDIALDKPGILLAAGDQIVAVDDREIHSYLGWDAADRLLSARMAANPDDPRPAVSYADLAYRAGKPEGIAQAADRALGAIERDPGSAVNQAARGRLFASLREMVETAEDGWAAPPAGLPARARPKSELSPAQLADLVMRLGRAAGSHEDRVVFLLCSGRLEEARGNPALAVEAYQGILTDSALAGAEWASLAEPTAVRGAGAEASRRLRDLVIASGRGVYSAFDAEVDSELAALGAGDVSAEALAGLARKYPVARAAVRIWERAADSWRRAGRTDAEIAGLGSALEAAELSVAIGPSAGDVGDAPAAELGEAAGRLVRALQRAGRPETAAHTLARVRTRWPTASLSEGGATLDAGALRRELDAAMAGPARLARIGTVLGAQEQQFPDWAVLRPLDPNAPIGSPEHLMMASDALGEVALFGVDYGEEAGVSRGRLRKLWSRPYQDQAPVLLRSEPGAVYFAWMEPDGGNIRALERIDSVGGQTRWRTGAPAELMPEDAQAMGRMTDGNGSVTRLETRQGPRFITQVIALIDGESVALVERTGRIAILDAETGQPRARFVAPVGAVFDATAAHGVLAIAGAVAPPAAVQEEPQPIAAAYDLRTGSEMRVFKDLEDQVRWLRVAPHGLLLLAQRTEVVARDLSSGAEAWAMQCAETRDAWLFDAPGLEETIFLLNDPDRELFRGSLADGSVGDAPIELANRLDAMSRIDAAVVGGRVALMNSKGVVLLAADGHIAGMDALHGGEALVAPVATEGSFVALQTQEVILPDNRPTYRLSLLSTSSLALQAEYDLVLWAVPTRAAAVDGRIVVTAGRMTVVYPAP